MNLETFRQYLLECLRAVRRAFALTFRPRAYVARYRDELTRPYAAIFAMFATVFPLTIATQTFFAEFYNLDFSIQVAAVELILMMAAIFAYSLATSYFLVFVATAGVRQFREHAWDVAQAINASFVLGFLTGLIPYVTLYPAIPDIRTQEFKVCTALRNYLEPSGCAESSAKLQELTAKFPVLQTMAFVTLIILGVLSLAMVLAISVSRFRFVSEFYGIPTRRLLLRLILWPVFLPVSIVTAVVRAVRRAPDTGTAPAA